MAVCFNYFLSIAIFLNIDISQGSVATRIRCGGIFKYELVANLQMSLLVKESWKSVNITRSYGQEFGVLFFLRHSVVVVAVAAVVFRKPWFHEISATVEDGPKKVNPYWFSTKIKTCLQNYQVNAVNSTVQNHNIKIMVFTCLQCVKIPLFFSNSVIKKGFKRGAFFLDHHDIHSFYTSDDLCIYNI